MTGHDLSEHEWSNMLNELLDVDEGLTDWEVEFIESIRKQRDGRGGWYQPSDKQRAIIVKIWGKAFR